MASLGLDDDDAQYVVEVVGHAAGELPQRLEPLRLPKLFLQSHLIRDVLDHALEDGFAVRGLRHRAAADPHRESAPVLAIHFDLRLLPPLDPPQHFGTLLGMRIQIGDGVERP